MELLRETTSSLAAPDGESAAAAPVPARGLAAPVSPDEDDTAVLGRVTDFYHACLKRTPAALAYLTKDTKAPEGPPRHGHRRASADSNLT